MFIARIALVACLGVAPLTSQDTAKSKQSPTDQNGSKQDAKGTSNDDPSKKDSSKNEEPVDEALERRRAAIRDRIQRERARRRSQKIVRTHVSVRVKLRNGERLRGIVKNGNFVERPSGGLEFVRAEMTQKDAGLRLWYYNNTDGYMFLPYTMIETYKVLKRLTDVEINLIRDEIREQERIAKKAAEARRKELEDKAEGLKKDQKAGEKLDKLAKDIKAKEEKAKADAKFLKLVEEFPPSEGWGEQRINQINIRRLTIKVYPNAKERRFIEVFDDWKKGRDIWIEKQKKGTPADDAKAKSESKGTKGKSASTTESKSGSKGSAAKPKPGK